MRGATSVVATRLSNSILASRRPSCPSFPGRRSLVQIPSSRLVRNGKFRQRL